MNQTEDYIENRLGLQELLEDDKITFVQLPGDHLQFTEENINEIFVPFITQQ